MRWSSDHLTNLRVNSDQSSICLDVIASLLHITTPPHQKKFLSIILRTDKNKQVSIVHSQYLCAGLKRKTPLQIINVVD